MTDIVERLQAWAECGPNALLEAASADLFEAADEIDRLRAENERLESENKSFRKVLTMIAEKHGQCGECGRDAAANNGGFVDCVDERPDWYLYRSRCWWEPGDPARRARAALEDKSNEPREAMAATQEAKE